MAKLREKRLHEIKELFVDMERWIQANQAMSHQNAFKGTETDFCELLNLIMKWNLKNADPETKSSQDSFDLYDSRRRIVVQVTVTQRPEKIRNTLKTFVKKHRGEYDRLVFAYPTLKLSKSEADFRKEMGDLDFVADRDRISFATLLKKLDGAPTELLDKVIVLLHSIHGPISNQGGMSVSRAIKTVDSFLLRILRVNDAISLSLHDSLTSSELFVTQEIMEGGAILSLSSLTGEERIAFLGPAGSGKSTLARQLERRFAASALERLQTEQPFVLPIFANAEFFQNSRNIPELLFNLLGETDSRTLINAVDVLHEDPNKPCSCFHLIVDAFDETEYRAHQCISNLTNCFGSTKGSTVFSRDAGDVRISLPRAHRIANLQPLARPSQIELIDKYFKEDEPSNSRVKQLVSKLELHIHAQRPLFLTLLCLAHSQPELSSQFEIVTRASILQHATRNLCRLRWKRSQSQVTLADQARIDELFNELAWDLFCENPRRSIFELHRFARIAEKHAGDGREPATLMKLALASGIIETSDVPDGNFRFAHRLFHEYYAAKFASNGYPSDEIRGVLLGFLGSEPGEETKTWQPETTEFFCLLSGCSDNPASLLRMVFRIAVSNRDIADSILLLSGQMLSDADESKLDVSIAKEIIDEVGVIFQYYAASQVMPFTKGFFPNERRLTRSLANSSGKTWLRVRLSEQEVFPGEHAALRAALEFYSISSPEPALAMREALHQPWAMEQLKHKDSIIQLIERWNLLAQTPSDAAGAWDNLSDRDQMTLIGFAKADLLRTVDSASFGFTNSAKILAFGCGLKRKDFFRLVSADGLVSHSAMDAVKLFESLIAKGQFFLVKPLVDALEASSENAFLRLSGLLNSDNKNLKFAAMHGFTFLKQCPKQASDLCLKTLKDPGSCSFVRGAAAWTIVELRAIESDCNVKAAYYQFVSEYRLPPAIEGLASLPEVSTIQVLAQLLKVDQHTCQTSAVFALGRMGLPACVNLLLGELENCYSPSYYNSLVDGLLKCDRWFFDQEQIGQLDRLARKSQYFESLSVLDRHANRSRMLRLLIAVAPEVALRASMDLYESVPNDTFILLDIIGICLEQGLLVRPLHRELHHMDPINFAMENNKPVQLKVDAEENAIRWLICPPYGSEGYWWGWSISNDHTKQ